MKDHMKLGVQEYIDALMFDAKVSKELERYRSGKINPWILFLLLTSSPGISAAKKVIEHLVSYRRSL
jgi:hypothetical protein